MTYITDDYFMEAVKRGGQQAATMVTLKKLVEAIEAMDIQDPSIELGVYLKLAKQDLEEYYENE